jgi:FkbM family methyltransferase
MTDYFDTALHYLGQNNKDRKTFVMNIGSMDGVMFDEMHAYSAMYGFKGLYVEPIPYLFDKLKTNISPDGNLFENSAISDYNGEIEMITIDRDAIDTGKIHSCFYGMSAVYPPKNGLGSDEDKMTVDKYGIRTMVKCITFDTLMRKHSIEQFDVVKIDAEGHDYEIFKQIDFSKYKPKVVRLEWINLSDEDHKHITDTFNKYDYVYEIESQDITAVSKSFKAQIDSHHEPLTTNITFVTGLWDIGRSNLDARWSRKYQDYLDNFSKLLKADINMIIFGDAELEQFVWKHRHIDNTMFVLRGISWFVNNDYYEKIQKIRSDPKWYQQVGWLSESTQAKLPLYNPLVMSKMFLLNDAQIFDKFDSEYMYWIDAGIPFTVHPGYFTHDKVHLKLHKYVSKFTFITFPYHTTSEIHGFEYDKICQYAKTNVTMVSRGGFFGGPKKRIPQINSIYYSLLVDTLSNGLMGTEESIFSIIVYRYADITNYIEIEGNGLLFKFFEDLKNDKVVVKSTTKSTIKSTIRCTSDIKTNLYVLTYNFPEQLERLLQSFDAADGDFLASSNKFLLNNSTDRSTDASYDDICNTYGFEQIKKDNIGICGGRQFIAEHFDASNADYYIFFEDDMMLYGDVSSTCNSGFRNYAKGLYDKTLQIMEKEKYDFLKLNFSEVYGGNDTQWAWYNVPDDVRIKYFPNNIAKPEFGLDPNPPKTQFTNIKRHEDISYIEGEIYYCNWPMWFNKAGNEKVFLEPKYEHPYEQTWMSLVYQKHKQNLFRTAVLLLSPVNHNRSFYYGAEDRKEN